MLDIEMQISNISHSKLQLQLPAWRPGRYELGNFAKNVRDWQAYDGSGNILPFKKLSKDLWEVDTQGAKNALIKYNYYCNQLDAGSCFLDQQQLYVNPVHCFLYQPDKLNEACELELKVPSDYKIASSLAIKGNTLIAKDFHELADSPFIASKNIQHQQFSESGCNYHVWIQGECKPNWEKLISDIKAYTREQVEIMGPLPVSTYHYLYQILPYSFHHGVEHQANTVIAFGPGFKLMQGENYDDFIGVSSHELYHAWNIKALRPKEMLPYDYSKENYSPTSYISEGVTTYMGDLALARSGVYPAATFLSEFKGHFQRHFDNYGRFHMSVAQASFDSWLDGYQASIPHRKVSIYDEGSIVALLLDLTIRHFSDSRNSLGTTMKSMYDQYGKTGKGYKDENYQQVAEAQAGTSLDWFFKSYVHGTKNYEDIIKQCLDYAGLQLEKKENSGSAEKFYGFKSSADAKITVVAPNSPAEKAGLTKDDEIAAINGFKVENNNLNALLDYSENPVLTVFSMKQLKEITLKKSEENYYPIISVVKNKDASSSQKDFFKKWLKQDF